MNYNTVVKIIGKVENTETNQFEYSLTKVENIKMFIVPDSDTGSEVGESTMRGEVYKFVAECEIPEAKLEDKVEDAEGNIYVIKRLYMGNFEGSLITRGSLLKSV